MLKSVQWQRSGLRVAGKDARSGDKVASHMSGSHPKVVMSRWLCGALFLITADNTLSSAIVKNKNCAIILSSAGTVVTGRDVCLRYEDVEEAFSLAREKVGLRFPARQVNDLSIAHLGTALQETSRILAKRFWLSRWEVENALPRLDTERTEVGRYCAWPLRRPAAPCPQERYRRLDATCNNLLDQTRGAAGLPFKRLLPPLYADRISEPRVGKDGSPLPLPRLVSTRVHADVAKRHDIRVSFMFPAWGQLIDHDLTLTAETKDPETRKEIDCCARGLSPHPNCYPLEVPREDTFYKERHQTCLNLARSLAGVRSGCALGSRTQINLNTAYIDANFIYGSGNKIAESLRLHQKGQLKTFDAFPELGLKPLLPPKTKQPDDGCLRPHPDIYCFLAGDNRVNEQLALGVLHTLAVREHNRIATELSYINPHWDDEKLYQEARHIIAAIVQHITYNEFLPQLLGETFLKQYDLKLNPEGYNFSYDPEVDATIPASFGTAAFRFGHSLLPNTMQRRSPNHKLSGERKLSEMLQQPFDLYKPGWVDAYVLGLVNQISQPMDHSVTIEVTNHLFQEPARDFGRDLAAINLARAREHGIPGYMAYRKHCGLNDMDTWQDMWSFLPNATVTEYLKLYDHPDDVDLWSAGVSELPAPGSMLGPVFSCIIATTFRDLKKGDRFWYENPGFPSSFSLRQLKEIKKYTLARLLCNTGDNIDTIQMKVMQLPDYDENPRVSCKSSEIADINLNYWKETTQVHIEEEQKYSYESQPTISNHSEGYLPPLTYYPWTNTNEKLPNKNTFFGRPGVDTVKEQFAHGYETGNKEKGVEQYLLNPLNLDDLSPPFPDLIASIDKYAISEESSHGTSFNYKKKFEENTSIKSEFPANSYSAFTVSSSYNYNEKYPTKEEKGHLADATSNYDLPYNIHLPTSVEITKSPLMNKNDSKEQISMGDHNYFVNNKKFITEHNEDYLINYETSTEYPTTISNIYYSPDESHSQNSKLDDIKSDFIGMKHVYKKPIDTSLVPPAKQKPDYSSVIEDVSKFIEKYSKDNYSDSALKDSNESHNDPLENEELKKGYFITTAECHTSEKEITSITSTPGDVLDIYFITESVVKSVDSDENKYSKLKPPVKEDTDRVEAKGFHKTDTDLVASDKKSSNREKKDSFNVQTNIIHDKSQT